MKKCLPILLLLSAINLFGQSTLTQGDIAFIGWNLDGTDGYTFIFLTDVDSGTTINFTDCGWSDASSAFSCNTGDANGWTWKINKAGGLNLGDVVTITMNAPGMTADTGTVSGTAGVMSGLGDQILAYQGSSSSPTFIAGMHSDQSPTSANDANWSGGVTNNQTSALPNSLTTGTDAIRLHNSGAESDNWQFDCSSGTVSGNVNTIRSSINSISNWNNDNSNAYSPVDPQCSWAITPVPVKLVDFRAVSSPSGAVILKWTTATEINNSHFIIERRSRNGYFEEIGRVEGFGNSTQLIDYMFEDESTSPKKFGARFYRLNQVDFDGSNEFSGIVKVVSNEQAEATDRVFIRPNPTTRFLDIEIDEEFKEDVQIIVMDSYGRTILTTKVPVDAPKMTKMDIHKLPVGIYTIQVIGASLFWTDSVVKID